MPNEITRQQPEDRGALLSNARPFAIGLWSADSSVGQIVAALQAELQQECGLRGQRAKIKRHLQLIVLNLLVNSLYAAHPFTAYHRRKAAYVQSARYNRQKVTYRLVKVIDALIEAGYVENHLGFRNPGDGSGRISRMRATERLLRLILRESNGEQPTIASHPDSECIVLRSDEDNSGDSTILGQDIDYPETGETRRMRQVVERYNACLSRFDLGLRVAEGTNGIAEPNVPQVDFGDRQVRRIFNGSFRCGGRFYGGWWQGISEEWRSRILIAGRPVTELDYSGIHIRLLYAIAGHRQTASRMRDPYQIDGVEQSLRMRKLVKKIYLIALNSAGRQNALAAIRALSADEPEEFGWMGTDEVDIERILNSFVTTHAPIRDRLFSGIGLELQYYDSQIAERIILDLMRQNIPVLTIHDSFIVQDRSTVALYQSMQYAFSKFLISMGGTDRPEPTRIKATGCMADEINRQVQASYLATGFFPDRLPQVFHDRTAA
jgi:hypothetical protein